MPLCSARPDLLHHYARRARADAAAGDDAVALVTQASALCRARCPALAVPSTAALFAASTTDEATTLARAVSQVAAAFESADARPAPAGVHAPTELALARRIASRYPGLGGGVLGVPLDLERGRVVGRRLRTADARQAAQILDRLGAAGQDPEVAAGILDGLGAVGLAALVQRADRETTAYDLSLTARRALVHRLGSLLATAASTVAPLLSPTDAIRVSLYGFDLTLIDRLGRTADGRRALRAMVGGVDQVPGPVAISLAEALLLGPTAGDDHLASPGSTSMLVRADAGAEGHVMALLGASPAAAYRLELDHPTGPSPALTILERAGDDQELAAASAVVDAVVNTSVDEGWAKPWHRPVTGEVAAQEAMAVPRVLGGLVGATVDADSRSHVPPALSQALASAVDHHLDFFAAELHAHPEATYPADVDEVEPMTPTARFFQAIARDLPALARVAAVVRRPDLDGIDQTLADHPPGRLDAASIHDVSTRDRPLVDELRHGADAAGRGDRLAVLLALRLGTKVLPKAVAAAGSAAGPWGPAVATGINAATPAAGRAAGDRWGHRDDGREDVVVDASPYRAAHHIAMAMAADPDWRAVLRFTPVVPTAGALAALDLDRSAADRRRFDGWLAHQDPVVSEAIDPLVHPAPD